MTDTNMAAAVELHGIAKSFRPGMHLFDDLQLSVGRAESVAIVGPSGCGKSTLLNIIALLEKPDQGEITYDGVARTTKDVGSQQLSYIFQRDALLPWATVMENLLLGAKCRNLAVDQAEQRAISYLHRVGLRELEHRYPDSLSGGQRQLIALIQNLVIQPNLLLLDEPFAFLDFQTKLLLEAELLRIVRFSRKSLNRPTSLVIVTHDIEEAIVIADRVLVLGGYPARPTQIVKEIIIEISEEARDPVSMREGEVLPRHFQEAWDTMRPFGPQLAGKTE